ncbi:hypothetical protein PV08_08503 [Exophiala spinifera]|uniref:Uncharacterized protein n=1 Tax=Exophiala spinifera TaxID=91928 RepID=A0A0D2B3Q6_9EURO|nr:uncharacterized protein PV08_08503 [Exophiala spinifera]KIW13315.1 hypothetical protein PV08_08503 [Exophiala spinifera]
MFQDEQVKQAILDYGACGDALFHMRKFVQELFTVISLKVEEVTVSVQGRKRKLLCYNRKHGQSRYTEISNTLCSLTGGPPAGNGLGDERVFSHHMFVAALKGKCEGVVIDLANAQYGHFDTILPVSRYFPERVRKVTSIQPIGTYDETFGSLLNEPNSLYFEKVQFGALRLHSLLRAWLAEKNLTLTGLVTLDKESFQTKLAVLREYASRGVRATVKKSLESGDLMNRLKQVDTLEEEARLTRRRLDWLKASGITIDMMQPQNRSWVGW